MSFVAGGIVLVRLAGVSAARKTEIVAAAINRCQPGLAGGFTVIAPGICRTRRLNS